MVAVLCGLAVSQDETTESLQRFAYAQVHMGVRVDIVLYAPDQVTADTAAKAAYSRYAELEQVMSDYRPSSELMQLCARSGEGPVQVSEELFDVLSLSLEMSRLTNGAFDVTASPVIKAWRSARRLETVPSKTTLEILSSLVGWEMVSLDPFRRTVSLELHNMQLDLGGIAKGYANDEALRVLSVNGVNRAMIQAGGDISVSGPPPGKQGWAVQVWGMPDTLYLSHAAVGTSGDTEQFVIVEGVRYSHIVDPRTGYGSTTRIQATVISPNGALADAFGTAATIMPQEQTYALAKKLGVSIRLTVVKD